MTDPKTSVEFRTLAIGQRFWCYLHSENGNPRWCECMKDANNFATEVGGITFRLSGESLVSLDKAAFQPKPMIPHFEPIQHDDKGLEWGEHGRLVGYSVTVTEGMASMPWKDFSELTDKAAKWDAYEAKRRELLTEGEKWLEDAEVFHQKMQQLLKEIEL